MTTVREKYNSLLEEINSIPLDDLNLQDLDEATYTLSEGGEPLSFDQALLGWKLVEYLLSTPLDNKFKL